MFLINSRLFNHNEKHGMIAHSKNHCFREEIDLNIFTFNCRLDFNHHLVIFEKVMLPKINKNYEPVALRVY